MTYHIQVNDACDYFDENVFEVLTQDTVKGNNNFLNLLNIALVW